MAGANAKTARTNPWVYTGVVIVAALTFVVSLAWNDAIRAVLNEALGVGNTWWALLIYAILITIVFIIVAFILAKVAPNVLEKSA